VGVPKEVEAKMRTIPSSGFGPRPRPGRGWCRVALNVAFAPDSQGRPAPARSTASVFTTVAASGNVLSHRRSLQCKLPERGNWTKRAVAVTRKQTDRGGVRRSSQKNTERFTKRKKRGQTDIFLTTRIQRPRRGCRPSSDRPVKRSTGQGRRRGPNGESQGARSALTGQVGGLRLDGLEPRQRRQQRRPTDVFAYNVITGRLYRMKRGQAPASEGTGTVFSRRSADDGTTSFTSYNALVPGQPPPPTADFPSRVYVRKRTPGGAGAATVLVSANTGGTSSGKTTRAWM